MEVTWLMEAASIGQQFGEADFIIINSLVFQQEIVFSLLSDYTAITSSPQ